MLDNTGINIESILFSYIDEFKILFFPDQWSSIFLDYSKNEILALLFLYRYQNANMTEIAEYINAPLNTATGVVSRLEKKEMVERVRSKEDRRIVQICLTEKAKGFIIKEKEILECHFKNIYEALTEEEKNAAVSIFRKGMKELKGGIKTTQREAEKKKIRKITIE